MPGRMMRPAPSRSAGFSATRAARPRRLQMLTSEPTVGDEDPTEVERCAVQREVMVAAITDVAAEPLDDFGWAERHHGIAGGGQVVG